MRTAQTKQNAKRAMALLDLSEKAEAAPVEPITTAPLYKVTHVDYDGSRIVSYECGQPLSGLSEKGARLACERLTTKARRQGESTIFSVRAIKN